MPYRDLAEAVALANRGWAACASRCSATPLMQPATSSSAPHRSTAACWSSIATMPREHRPRLSPPRAGSWRSPAGRRVRGDGRRSRGSSTTCSAPRSNQPRQ
jgi:hypothetical protein